MKANEFVKAMGLSAVKTFLDNGNIRSAEMAVELKRLVRSHELVEAHGGLEKAKEMKIGYFPLSFIMNTERLEKAIADVEACQ